MTLTQLIHLVLVKTVLNLRAEASESYLNYVWWLLEPLLHMGVFYIVFSVFMNSAIPNFVPFLLCGLVPWLWFSKSVSNGASSIVQHSSLLAQFSITPIFFPFVVITQDLVKQLPVLLVLLVFVWIYGLSPSAEWIYLLPLVIIQYFLNGAIAILLAGVIPFIPDVRFLIATGLQLMMFASGIFFDARDLLLPEHIPVFFLNPLAVIIEAYRSILIDHAAPDWIRLSVIFLVSALVVTTCHRVFKGRAASFYRASVE